MKRKLQALEIIIKKIVCIEVLLDTDNVNEYNNIISYHKTHSCSNYKCLYLSQEEYELLKEVLNENN